MDNTFYFKYDRFQNGFHSWVTNCGLCDEAEKNQFYLTQGDWDGCSGDLDEWLFISYDQIKPLKCLLSNKYSDWQNFELSNEAVEFREQKLSEEMKEIFLLLCIYFIKEKGDFDSFKKMASDNGIKAEYSVYRSSSD